jgi:hypothetical protein
MDFMVAGQIISCPPEKTKKKEMATLSGIEPEHLP